jgi:hypothetical protein
MRTSRLGILLLFAASLAAVAQVISPMEMDDPGMRRLQQEHLGELQAIATEITQHSFPYPFYFSRRLDIDEAEQKRSDQRSIAFERYNSQIALEITGNYYASYSDERLDGDHRVRQTYLDVIYPILRALVPKLTAEAKLEAFAVEVSHHVRKKVMGVSGEFPENVVFVIDKSLATKLMRAKDIAEQQELMLDAEIYRDREPVILWLTGDKPVIDESSARAVKAGMGPNTHQHTGTIGAVLVPTKPKAVPDELKAAPLHDDSPGALKALQEAHQTEIDKMVFELNETAHFVTYAPPTFISFKQGTYLQLSLTTLLNAGSEGSQYKLAALAFDRHISHLLRPVVGYLGSDSSKFDGIDFSTTVKVSGDEKGSYSEAVEFVLPWSALQCYQSFDCAGQQILTSGIVLINGERVTLDLQAAESR